MKLIYKHFKTVFVLSKMPYTCTSVVHLSKFLQPKLLKYYCTGQSFNNRTSDNGRSKFDDNPNSTTSSTDKESEVDEEEKLRCKILDASLPFVKEYGWAADTIAKGAECLGYSSMVHGMFENGGIDLVNFHYRKCNAELESLLSHLVEMNKADKIETNTSDFIHSAVETRLRMNAEYMDTWAKAMVLHASPSNIPIAIENLGTLVDTIWYYAGDRSVDSNWYARRGSLLVIYKTTEICMLQDQSTDFQETWSFLRRRINEVNAFDKGINQIYQRINDTSSVARIGLATIQNILGLNGKSR